MTTRKRPVGGNVRLSAELDAVVRGMARAEEDEMQRLTSADLENFWFFKWESSARIEWNIYQFTDLLELYRRKCRRWEELHNGSVCVVERVRDKYLMPKIAAFAQRLETSNAKTQRRA